MGPSDVAHFLLGNLEKVPSLEEDFTADDDTWWIRNQTQDGKGANALSTGTLTNQTYTLTLLNIVRKPVISSNLSLFGVEIGFKVFYFEYSLCDCRSPHFFVFYMIS